LFQTCMKVSSTCGNTVGVVCYVSLVFQEWGQCAIIT